VGRFHVLVHQNGAGNSAVSGRTRFIGRARFLSSAVTSSTTTSFNRSAFDNGAKLAAPMQRVSLRVKILQLRASRQAGDRVARQSPTDVQSISSSAAPAEERQVRADCL
jgi:hypothetical protein